jgi:hypothetical protein
MKLIRTVVAIACFGCTVAAPNVTSQHDRGATFARFKTYKGITIQETTAPDQIRPQNIVVSAVNNKPTRTEGTAVAAGRKCGPAGGLSNLGGWYYRRVTISRDYVVPSFTVCQPVYSWWGYACEAGYVPTDHVLASSGSNAAGLNGGARFYDQAQRHQLEVLRGGPLSLCLEQEDPPPWYCRSRSGFDSSDCGSVLCEFLYEFFVRGEK